MKFKDFKSGVYIDQVKYKSFRPEKINHEWSIDDDNIIVLLSKAERLLGELNAYVGLVPQTSFFIRLFLRKEAVASTHLSGNQANIFDSLQKPEKVETSKKTDWTDVYNYVNAMNSSFAEIKQEGLSNDVLKNAHLLILNSLREENKSPGVYRPNQAWVEGDDITDAEYIPPDPAEINDLMIDLDNFVKNQHYLLPHLIKIAIIHYQFLTIHPFSEANGRLARLLTALYLTHHEILQKPVLCLSDYFDKHKAIYHDTLMSVRQTNNLSKWIIFFLEAVIFSSEDSINIYKKTLEMRKKIVKTKIVKFGSKTKNANELLQLLFWQPIIETEDIISELKVCKNTALNLIYDFVYLGILVELTGFKRNRIYVFDKYVSLFN